MCTTYYIRKTYNHVMYKLQKLYVLWHVLFVKRKRKSLHYMLSYINYAFWHSALLYHVNI